MLDSSAFLLVFRKMGWFLLESSEETRHLLNTYIYYEHMDINHFGGFNNYYSVCSSFLIFQPVGASSG